MLCPLGSALVASLFPCFGGRGGKRSRLSAVGVHILWWEADRISFWIRKGGRERGLPPCFPRARGVMPPLIPKCGGNFCFCRGGVVNRIKSCRDMDGEVGSKFKRVCVFCGSNSGNRSVFSDAALELGHELVKRRINLVYGGGSVGLMGLISQTVYDGGCHVLGVIPTALMPLEISGKTVGDVRTVSDMHERKAEMARQSDAFIALPGGYGTMEELLEMITWSQLGIHNKPVGLLNVDGYYNSLLALFDNGVEEGFINPTARHIVISAPTAKDLLIKMEQYIPSHEQVAPTRSWEIANLGYTTQSNPP